MELFGRIKTALPLWDIAERYGTVQVRGGRRWMSCLFHDEKTASMMLHPDRYYCFACHAKGDVFDLAEALEHLGKAEAIEWLGKLAGIPEAELGKGRSGRSADRSAESKERKGEREILLEVLAKTADFFTGCLGDLGQSGSEHAREGLSNRKLPSMLVARVGFGYAPDAWNPLSEYLMAQGVKIEHQILAGVVVRNDKTGRPTDRFRNRLMIPICTKTGKIVSFAGRALPGSTLPCLKNADGTERAPAKYMNGPDTSVFSKGQILFGLDHALSMRGQGIWVLCEGYFDALALLALGIPAVATMGTALTTAQAKEIARCAKKVIIWNDPDPAGQRATRKSLPALLSQGVRVEILRPLTSGAAKMDPDEAVRTMGPDAVRSLLATGSRAVEDWSSWLIRYILFTEGLSRARKQDRLLLVRNVAEVLVQAYPESEPARIQVDLLAMELEVPVSSVQGAITAARGEMAQERPRAEQDNGAEKLKAVPVPELDWDKLEQVICLALEAMADGNAQGLEIVRQVDRSSWERRPYGCLVLEVLDQGGVPESALAIAALVQASARRSLKHATGNLQMLHLIVRRQDLQMNLEELDEILARPEALAPTIREGLVRDRIRLRCEIQSLAAGQLRKTLVANGNPD